MIRLGLSVLTMSAFLALPEIAAAQYPGESQHPGEPQYPNDPTANDPAPADGGYPPSSAPPPAPAEPPPYAQPAPADPYAQPAPAAQPPPPSYAAQPPAHSPPPPPPQSGGGGFTMPDFSVRIDPLNWLLQGRLGLELEFELLEWLTIEAIPMFVVSEEPVFFNNLDELTQESDGLGALAGTSLGVGFWLDGDSFNGTVLRVGLLAYGVKYTTRALQDYPTSANGSPIARGDVLDTVTDSQRRLSFTIGSHRTWGYFTLVGGISLEYETNDKRRCYTNSNGIWETRSSEPCDDDQLQIAREPTGLIQQPSVYNLYGWLHPFDLAGRLSLGVVFD